MGGRLEAQLKVQKAGSGGLGHVHAFKPCEMYLLIVHFSRLCDRGKGHAGGLAELTLVFSQVLLAIGRPSVLGSIWLPD